MAHLIITEIKCCWSRLVITQMGVYSVHLIIIIETTMYLVYRSSTAGHNIYMTVYVAQLEVIEMAVY